MLFARAFFIYFYSIMLFIAIFLCIKYEQGSGEHKEERAPLELREIPEGASERRGGAL